MTKRTPGLRSRLLIGAIAGFAGTMAMTSAMRRLHRQLPSAERYPLTPREITDAAATAGGLPAGEEAIADATIAAHFLYGAVAGSLIAAVNPRIGRGTGAMAGVAVWVASYLGWIPGVGLLKPATDHPPRRNLLMIAAHVVWGTSTAVAMRELVESRDSIFQAGPEPDVAPELRDEPA
jgi:hypothetical protein